MSVPAEVRLTLTWDQVSEMAEHHRVAERFAEGVYSPTPAHPGSAAPTSTPEQYQLGPLRGVELLPGLAMATGVTVASFTAAHLLPTAMEPLSLQLALPQLVALGYSDWYWSRSPWWSPSSAPT